jgi:hypothetical protein
MAVGYEGLFRPFCGLSWAPMGATTDERSKTAATACADFLRVFLRDGRRQRGEIAQAAHNLGFSDKVLRIARVRLGVVSKRVGFGPGSSAWWSLPDGDTGAAPASRPRGDHAPDWHGRNPRAVDRSHRRLAVHSGWLTRREVSARLTQAPPRGTLAAPVQRKDGTRCSARGRLVLGGYWSPLRSS